MVLLTNSIHHGQTRGKEEQKPKKNFVSVGTNTSPMWQSKDYGSSQVSEELCWYPLLIRPSWYWAVSARLISDLHSQLIVGYLFSKTWARQGAFIESNEVLGLPEMQWKWSHGFHYFSVVSKTLWLLGRDTCLWTFCIDPHISKKKDTQLHWFLLPRWIQKIAMATKQVRVSLTKNFSPSFERWTSFGWS